MYSMLKRHEVQVLHRAGLTQESISEISGVPLRSVQRIITEPPVVALEIVADEAGAGAGRPSIAEPFRAFVAETLAAEPRLKTIEVLRRMRLEGYDGGKSAAYELVKSVRPEKSSLTMRFEGLPGEFSQHDFGEVWVEYVNGDKEKIRFFASRLKYSRFVQVTVVDDQKAETLVRTLCDHFEAFGGVPLLAVFDRPRTVAKSWQKNGEVTEWNPFFAHTALELRIGVELCWPRQPQQKGSVENLVGWVKGSFFKQRRFIDRDDLLAQLGTWHQEANFERACRATKRIPAELLEQESPRLRPVRVTSETLGLPIPISVGPTADVTYDTNRYSMPPLSAGYSGMLYLYRDRVRIVAGKYSAEHPRLFGRDEVSRGTDHRAKTLAKISGRRGKAYLKRENLLELGEIAGEFLTELVHNKPKSWWSEVDELWECLQAYGADPMRFALHMACAERRFTADAVLDHLIRGVQGRLV